jgi:hypothetical protein
MRAVQLNGWGIENIHAADAAGPGSGGGRGRLHTPVAGEFNVEQAHAAYEEFASGPHRGRIVLTF